VIIVPINIFATGVQYHKLAGEIAGLINTKYGWSDGLILELTPHKEQIK
jgi:hypothetical protein